MRYVFLVLLAAALTWHLIESWKDNVKRRAYTKPFLIPFVLLYYVFSSHNILWFLIAALVFSWLGDVFLMIKGNKWFTIGGCCFGVGHILFVITYIGQIVWSSVKLYVVIPVAIVYIVITTFVIRAVIKKTPKPMIPAMYLYLVANGTMNVFAIMQLMSHPCAATIIAYIGALLFYFSDCTLFLVRYSEHPDKVFKKHFTVMFLYVVGEFMITQGLLMLVG